MGSWRPGPGSGLGLGLTSLGWSPGGGPVTRACSGGASWSCAVPTELGRPPSTRGARELEASTPAQRDSQGRELGASRVLAPQAPVLLPPNGERLLPGFHEKLGCHAGSPTWAASHRADTAVSTLGSTETPTGRPETPPWAQTPRGARRPHGGQRPHGAPRDPTVGRDPTGCTETPRAHGDPTVGRDPTGRTETPRWAETPPWGPRRPRADRDPHGARRPHGAHGDPTVGRDPPMGHTETPRWAETPRGARRPHSGQRPHGAHGDPTVGRDPPMGPTETTGGQRPPRGAETPRGAGARGGRSAHRWGARGSGPLRVPRRVASRGRRREGGVRWAEYGGRSTVAAGRRRRRGWGRRRRRRQRGPGRGLNRRARDRHGQSVRSQEAEPGHRAGPRHPATEAAARQAEAVPEEGLAAAGAGAGPGPAAAAGRQEGTGQAAAQEEAVPGAAPGQDGEPDQQPGGHGAEHRVHPDGGEGAGGPAAGERVPQQDAPGDVHRGSGEDPGRDPGGCGVPAANRGAAGRQLHPGGRGRHPAGAGRDHSGTNGAAGGSLRAPSGSKARKSPCPSKAQAGGSGGSVVRGSWLDLASARAWPLCWLCGAPMGSGGGLAACWAGPWQGGSGT